MTPQPNPDQDQILLTLQGDHHPGGSSTDLRSTLHNQPSSGYGFPNSQTQGQFGGGVGLGNPPAAAADADMPVNLTPQQKEALVKKALKNDKVNNNDNNNN